MGKRGNGIAHCHSSHAAAQIAPREWIQGNGMTSRWIAQLAALIALVAMPAAAAAADIRPDQAAFRELFEELVETNTTLSAGSCTLAAERMAVRMKAAGFADSDVTVFADPAFPKEGGLVAKLGGTDKRAKPMLLLAHLDVVEARREDWTRDPFTLIEENGFFYARGVLDDKAQAAIWTDALIRLKQQGFKPKRSIKLALTCGEETTYAFNGVEWLAKNHPDWIAAEFALNEGGGGVLDAKGERQILSMQVGEKAAQNYRLETTNPGGHSSRPVPENAIYDLAGALKAVEAKSFPVMFTDTTRAYFTSLAKIRGGEFATMATRLLANPDDAEANRLLSRDATLHSTLRTTCVATLLDGGHANNALPQRAGANINCRIFPGITKESVRDELAAAIANPKVSITPVPPLRPIAVPPPLDKRIMAVSEMLAKKHFPGVPILPTMATGATDAVFLAAVKMPVYGVPGIFAEPDFNGVHGLNERIRARSLYEGRDYLFDMVRELANIR
jgi:acetylornithine deacetylase/succinyl-diaminopimelate desuccinylase-like protein